MKFLKYIIKDKVPLAYYYLDTEAYFFFGSPFENMQINYRSGNGEYWRYRESSNESEYIPWNINLIYEL